MVRPKKLPSSSRAFAVIVAIVALLNPGYGGGALAQSGRTRPRVPTPRTETPAEPIKIPAAAAVVKQDQIGTASQFVLKNGVTVIIKELHSAPIVAIDLRFDAGTAAEPEGEAGIARLLQRMVLRGSVLRTDPLTELRGLGAILDANITYSAAAYSLLAPAEKMKDALAIESDLLTNPALEARALEHEIPSVIAEEKWRARLPLGARPLEQNLDAATEPTLIADDASAYSLARLISLAYAGTPAGKDRAAAVEDLRTITRDQLVAFYKAHYRLDGLTVAVVGDVVAFNALVAVQQLFGTIGASEASSIPVKPSLSTRAGVTPAPTAGRPGATIAAKPSPSPPQGALAHPAPPGPPSAAQSGAPAAAPAQPALRYAEERGDVSQPLVTMGFRVPGFRSPDRAALELLAALIGQGRASRLQRSLLDGQMLVGRVAADWLPVAGDGLLAIQMVVASDPKGNLLIDRAESSLLRELDDVRRETPSEGEMARARAVVEKRWLDRNSSYAGRAALLTDLQSANIAFRDALDYRPRIRAVTAEDVRRMAARFLTIENLAVHEFEPPNAPPRTFDATSFTTTVMALVPGLAQSAESIKPRAADPASDLPVISQGAEQPANQQSLTESLLPLPIKDFSTLNGPRAFVREDHSSSLVAVALLFQGGRIVEDDNTSGTTELMLRCMLSGTPRRTNLQLANEWDQLGAEIAIVTERDFFGYVLSVPSRNSERALKLLRDVIEEPAFNDKDILRAKMAQAAAIHSVEDTGTLRALELFHRTIWPGSAYGQPPHGREAVIAKVTPEQLREFHEHAVKRQLPLGVIVGDTNGSALVSAVLADGFRRRDLEKSLQVKVPLPKPGEVSETRRRETADIALGFSGPKSDANDLLAVELLKAAMNGEGGRLLAELRDQQGLVLNAWTATESQFVGGEIYAQIVTEAGNEAKARTALLAEFNRLLRGGLTTEEAVRARQFAVTSNLARLQSQAARAVEYARSAFYQRAPADIDAFEAQLEKVTSDDANRAAATYLKPPIAAGVLHGTAASPSEPVKPPVEHTKQPAAEPIKQK